MTQTEILDFDMSTPEGKIKYAFDLAKNLAENPDKQLLESSLSQLINILNQFESTEDFPVNVDDFIKYINSIINLLKTPEFQVHDLYVDDLERILGKLAPSKNNKYREALDYANKIWEELTPTRLPDNDELVDLIDLIDKLRGEPLNEDISGLLSVLNKIIAALQKGNYQETGTLRYLESQVATLNNLIKSNSPDLAVYFDQDNLDSNAFYSKLIDLYHSEKGEVDAFNVIKNILESNKDKFVTVLKESPDLLTLFLDICIINQGNETLDSYALLAEVLPNVLENLRLDGQEKGKRVIENLLFILTSRDTEVVSSTPELIEKYRVLMTSLLVFLEGQDLVNLDTSFTSLVNNTLRWLTESNVLDLRSKLLEFLKLKFPNIYIDVFTREDSIFTIDFNVLDVTGFFYFVTQEEGFLLMKQEQITFVIKSLLISDDENYTKEYLKRILDIYLLDKQAKSSRTKIYDVLFNIANQNRELLSKIFTVFKNEGLIIKLGLQLGLLKGYESIDSELIPFLDALINSQASKRYIGMLPLNQLDNLIDLLFNLVPDELPASYLVNLESLLGKIDFDEMIGILGINLKDEGLSNLNDKFVENENKITNLKYGKFLIFLKDLDVEQVLEFINKAKPNKELRDIVVVLEALHPGVLNKYKRELNVEAKQDAIEILEDTESVIAQQGQKGLLGLMKNIYRMYVESSTLEVKSYNENRLVNDFINYVNNNTSEVVIAFSDPWFKSEFEDVIASLYKTLKGENRQTFNRFILGLVSKENLVNLLSQNTLDIYIEILESQPLESLFEGIKQIMKRPVLRNKLGTNPKFLDLIYRKANEIIKTPAKSETEDQKGFKFLISIIKYFSKQEEILFMQVAARILTSLSKKILSKRLAPVIENLGLLGSIGSEMHQQIFYVIWSEVINKKSDDQSETYRESINYFLTDKEKSKLQTLDNWADYFKLKSEYKELVEKLDYKSGEDILDSNLKSKVINFKANILSLVNRRKVLFSSVLETYNQLESQVLELDSDNLNKIDNKADLVESLYIFLFLTRNYPDLQKRIYKLIEHVMAIFTETDTFKEAISSADSKIDKLRTLDSAGNRRVVPLQDSKETAEYLRKAKSLITKKGLVSDIPKEPESKKIVEDVDFRPKDEEAIA